MNRNEFDNFIDDIFTRVGDPDSSGLAGEIGDSWLTCFNDDGGEIDNLEIITRMQNVLDDLRRELRRYEGAMGRAYEELGSEDDQEEITQ